MHATDLYHNFICTHKWKCSSSELTFKPGTRQPQAGACLVSKSDPMWMSVCVCVFACVSAPRLLITSGVMWHDMNPIQLVKQVLKLLYGNCSLYREWAWPWH